jgi:hypothetical protein
MAPQITKQHVRSSSSTVSTPTTLTVDQEHTLLATIHRQTISYLSQFDNPDTVINTRISEFIRTQFLDCEWVQMYLFYDQLQHMIPLLEARIEVTGRLELYSLLISKTYHYATFDVSFNTSAIEYHILCHHHQELFRQINISVPQDFSIPNVTHTPCPLKECLFNLSPQTGPTSTLDCHIALRTTLVEIAIHCILSASTVDPETTYSPDTILPLFYNSTSEFLNLPATILLSEHAPAIFKILFPTLSLRSFANIIGRTANFSKHKFSVDQMISCSSALMDALKVKRPSSLASFYSEAIATSTSVSTWLQTTPGRSLLSLVEHYHNDQKPSA